MAYNKYLASSENPEQLSLTIKGLLMFAVPIIVTVAKQNGVEVLESDIISFIDSVYVAIATTITLVGLLRKFRNSFK